MKYKDKAELFHNFFADLCPIINNSSVLSSVLLKRTENVISSINFCMDITKIIQKLDPYNAHGHDMFSICMLKICGSSICKPLQLISQSFIENEKFPSKCKKANAVPFHKNVNKRILENYRPVFGLCICGKIFESLIYNSLFEFFIENKLISFNQFGFKPDGSCINQLLPITHQIHKSFDD